MTITHIVVMLTHGTDRVALHTDLPSPWPPEVDSTPLQVKFEIQRGKGLAYVQEHFPGIPTEVLDAREGKRYPVEPG